MRSGGAAFGSFFAARLAPREFALYQTGRGAAIVRGAKVTAIIKAVGLASTAHRFCRYLEAFCWLPLTSDQGKAVPIVNPVRKFRGHELVLLSVINSFPDVHQ